MGVWEYTGLAVILMMIYYNDGARKKVKAIAKTVLDIIENSFDL